LSKINRTDANNLTKNAFSAAVRIFLDDDGTTYDESTALYWDIDIATKTTLSIDTFWAMNNSSGNLAYRTSVDNALTITIFGAEITNG